VNARKSNFHSIQVHDWRCGSLGRPHEQDKRSDNERGDEKHVDQLEVFLGHRVMGSVSELYAPFGPSYLRLVKGIVEEIIDEIETLAPGAFHRRRF
jgi:hypothetical protein